MWAYLTFRVRVTTCKMKIAIAMSECWQKGDMVKSSMRGTLHRVWEIRRTQIWWWLLLSFHLSGASHTCLLYGASLTALATQCEWKMLPAVPVTKGRCSHQAITLQLPWWWVLKELRVETNSLPSATAATPNCVPWGDSGWERTWYWPQIAEVHIKRMISVSPDSCIFQYIETC